MSKLPVISGEKAVKCFEILSYVVVRQKGSHIRMRHKSDKSRKPLTIPKHKVLGNTMRFDKLRGMVWSGLGVYLQYLNPLQHRFKRHQMRPLPEVVSEMKDTSLYPC